MLKSTADFLCYFPNQIFSMFFKIVVGLGPNRVKLGYPVGIKIPNRWVFGY